MIDLHAHVLPGLDDGPDTLEGSLALARAAVAAGTRTLVATPHIERTLAIDPHTVAPAVERLQAELDAHDIPLRLAAGGEVALHRVGTLDEPALTAAHLGDGPWLLVELSLHRDLGDVGPMLFDLRLRGHEVLLAHPERCPTFQRDPARVRRLVDQGVLCSVTAGALRGQFGRKVQRLGFDLLREGLVHNVASDAHDDERRPPGLTESVRGAVRKVPDAAGLVGWMTDEVPEAILAGAPIPPRPVASAAPAASRWPWRRRALA